MRVGRNGEKNKKKKKKKKVQGEENWVLQIHWHRWPCFDDRVSEIELLFANIFYDNRELFGQFMAETKGEKTCSIWMQWRRIGWRMRFVAHTRVCGAYFDRNNSNK